MAAGDQIRRNRRIKSPGVSPALVSLAVFSYVLTQGDHPTWQKYTSNINDLLFLSLSIPIVNLPMKVRMRIRLGNSEEKSRSVDSTEIPIYFNFTFLYFI